MEDRTEHSNPDPHWRWRGVRIDGDKTPEAAQRARAILFPNVADFAAWRKSKGMMPELSETELLGAYERFTGKTAHTISGGDAGAFVSKNKA